MSPLTEQLIEQIEKLSARKKAALLELLAREASENPSASPARFAEWKDKLLNTSAWAEDDLQAIEEARARMNQWTPKSL